jgi:hypothetical protein
VGRHRARKARGFLAARSSPRKPPHFTHSRRYSNGRWCGSCNRTASATPFEARIEYGGPPHLGEVAELQQLLPDLLVLACLVAREPVRRPRRGRGLPRLRPQAGARLGDFLRAEELQERPRAELLVLLVGHDEVDPTRVGREAARARRLAERRLASSRHRVLAQRAHDGARDLPRAAPIHALGREPGGQHLERERRLRAHHEEHAGAEHLGVGDQRAQHALRLGLRKGQDARDSSLPQSRRRVPGCHSEEVGERRRMTQLAEGGEEGAHEVGPRRSLRRLVAPSVEGEPLRPGHRVPHVHRGPGEGLERRGPAGAQRFVQLPGEVGVRMSQQVEPRGDSRRQPRDEPLERRVARRSKQDRLGPLPQLRPHPVARGEDGAGQAIRLRRVQRGEQVQRCVPGAELALLERPTERRGVRVQRGERHALAREVGERLVHRGEHAVEAPRLEQAV